MNTKLYLLVATLVVTQNTWTNDPHDPKQQTQTGRPTKNNSDDFFYGPFPHSGNTK